jgi:hypothetical protein
MGWFARLRWRGQAEGGGSFSASVADWAGRIHPYATGNAILRPSSTSSKRVDFRAVRAAGNKTNKGNWGTDCLPPTSALFNGPNFPGLQQGSRAARQQGSRVSTAAAPVCPQKKTKTV